MERDSMIYVKPLTISIPKDSAVEIERHYQMNKDLLVYLESPNCRKFMQESDRLNKLKMATERFKAILMYKAFNPS